MACDNLRKNPNFNGKEVNMVGFSQGCMIARSMVEGCDAVKVNKLMLFGGPNAGVSMIHDC